MKGFFGFLTRKKQVELGLDELEAWLNMQVSGKHLDHRISRSSQRLENLKAETHERINNLESAKLMNENIPERDKNIMEGHRKTYVQRMRRFVDGVSLPTDFADVGHHVAIFSENLGGLASETHKNQAVLKQFFDQEVSDVSRKLKDLESELSNLQSDIDKAGTEQIKEAKIRLRQYKEDLARKERLESEKGSREAELEILKNKKAKIERRLTELKQSPDYAELKETLDHKRKLEESMSSIERDLIMIFSELSRPLKKFTHNSSNEKLVDRYTSDPIGALEEDVSLVINEVLGKMKDDLPGLELKDKQLEKTEEMLKKLNRDYLAKRRAEVAHLKAQNKELATKINRSVVALNISENESWAKSLSNKIDQIERELHHHDKQISEISPEYLFQKVKEKVKEVDGSVRIKDP